MALPRIAALLFAAILALGQTPLARAACDNIAPELFDTMRTTATAVHQEDGAAPPMRPFEFPVTVRIEGPLSQGLGFYAFARRTDVPDAPVERQMIDQAVATSDGAGIEVTLRVKPPGDETFLRQATYQLLVVGCRASPGGRQGPLTLDPASGALPSEIVSFRTTQVTFSTWFSGIVWAAAILVLCSALLAVWAMHLGREGGGFGRGLMRVFSGFNGRVSFSNFQLFIFFFAVLGTVAYVFGRTRELSDLSQDVLLLLGISAVSATAATVGDVNKNRLSWSNWVWLKRQGAFPDPKTSKLSWFQLVSSSGGFDMYRFQALMFTLLVAPTFVIMSVYALGEARIPQGVLAVLGISQATYVVGKIFGPPTIADFDKQITDYRAKKKDGTATDDDREELLAAFQTAIDEDWADTSKLT